MTEDDLKAIDVDPEDIGDLMAYVARIRPFSNESNN